MVSPGAGDSHLQGAPCLGLNPVDENVHPGEMQRRIKDIFSILLPATDTVRLFGEMLKLSRIVAVPQAHFCPCLTLNLLEKPEKGMLSVNNTTGMEAAPKSLKFERDLLHILQEVWEVDTDQGPFRVSKLNITDAYHRGTVMPLQVGAFAYVVHPAPGDKGCIICIGLVLTMG